MTKSARDDEVVTTFLAGECKAEDGVIISCRVVFRYTAPKTIKSHFNILLC